MWEVAIILDVDFLDYFKYIQKRIKKAFLHKNLVCSLEIDNNQAKLLVACDKKDKEEIFKLLNSLLASFFATAYKEAYIRSKLNLNKVGKLEKESFLKAMVCFDLEYDKKYIFKKLDYKNTLYLNSFFTFKCKNIKSKWNDIIELTNDNALFLQEKKIFLELLKFLIANLKVNSDFVNVYYEKSSYKFLDKHNKKLKVENISGKSKDAVLITNLISLNPKNINFYYDKSITIEALNLIATLFENRLTLHNILK